MTMKSCDYVEKTFSVQKDAKPCGKDAAVKSSLGKRHRCPDHHWGPGWASIETERKT